MILQGCQCRPWLNTNGQYALYATPAGSAPPATLLSNSYAYGYNPLNWTTSTTTLSGTDTLVHDARGRLTSESGPQVVATGGSYKWTYDNNGNLLSQIGDDGYPVTYTYTQAITPNQLQTMVMGDGQPTAYYGYDVHGDTTAITDGALLNTHLTYDSQARPTQITKLDHRTPVTVTLTYNPSGQRASYHVIEPGQPTLDQQFTYRGGLLGQVRLTSGTTAYTDTYLYTDAGAPYELLRTTPNGATSRYWYELDGRGNVVALTDSTGKVVDRYAYDSWGELTSNDATDETVPQQLRYAGYWYDEKLSWYWLNVRYYDPEIERFLAPDPSEQDGVCTYRYVADDPIDLTDPSGQCKVDVRFRPLRSIAGILFSHAYLRISQGSTTLLAEANPENGGLQQFLYGYGHIKAEIGTPEQVDGLSTEEEAHQVLKTIVLVDNSDSCTTYLENIADTINRTNNANIDYELSNFNSNSFAYTAAVRLYDMLGKSKVGVRVGTNAPTWSPGWGTYLPCLDGENNRYCRTYRNYQSIKHFHVVLNIPQVDMEARETTG